MENDKLEQVKMDYHLKQIQKPYRSTEVFVKWLEEKGVFEGSVLDVGAGGGANLIYVAKISRN